MTTWSCKAATAGLALTLLTACEPGQFGLSLPPIGGAVKEPVTQTKLAAGSLAFKAPSGYCFDPTSQGARFALLARCDKLGAGSGLDAPLTLITISVTPASDETALPDPAQTADALGLSNIAAVQTEESSVIYRADGAAPAPGMATRHWRATARRADHIVGLSLYTPEGGSISSDAARALLSDVINTISAGA